MLQIWAFQCWLVQGHVHVCLFRLLCSSEQGAADFSCIKARPGGKHEALWATDGLHHYCSHSLHVSEWVWLCPRKTLFECHY